ncbi:MAG: GGDEF domain-containing protein [Oscillospiraceae bacterium]|nr:GGDEF domain-containing protein [Oscillospiraceae bacterium]
MSDTDKKEYDLEEIFNFISNEIDGVFIIDAINDEYIAVKSNDMFCDMFGSTGSYLELSRILMFHFSDSSEKIIANYHVFLPKLNKFNGKYSKRIKIFYKEKPYIIQMTIYPLEDTGKHVLLLTEMDTCDYLQDFFTTEKEQNINSTYLFTMYVDLTTDMCSSVSVTEMSDSPMNYQELRYTQWRMMIVNMIFPDDQPMFLSYTDPEYIKEHLVSRRSTSFDCQMQNLKGEFIWVKIIFNKIETLHNDDFRFVYIVQDIHESSMRLIEDLKRYEELSNLDSLTGVFNHGKIENELYKYIELRQDENIPLSLLMLDIDYFKNVNDKYGHSAGDAVLKKLVSVIINNFKKYDITLGRWGGEEFIGICYGLNKTQLYEIAEKLRIAISKTEFDCVGHVTCSMGIIEINHMEKMHDAFERVDKALYTAKSNGRNCVICG